MPSRAGGKRVDGEIAPLGVGLPVAAERDLGVAAVGFDVPAQRRDFERMLVDDGSDGAVLDSRRHRLEAGRAETRRTTSSGTAVVATSISPTGRPSSALRTAPPTDARFLAVAVQHIEQPRQRALLEPSGALQAPRDRASRHLVVPGTNLPFSICAGT